MTQQRFAAPGRRGRAGLHPDRAPGRHHHHRHPARDRGAPRTSSFRDRANNSAANQANLRAAIPAIETYSADNVGTSLDADLTLATSGYQGMDLAQL